MDKEENKPVAAPKEQEAEAKEENKLAELSDKLLRAAAEFDNYKKRAAKEKEQAAKHSANSLMLRFLPIYEETALAYKEAEKLPESGTKKGILLVLGKMRAQFEKEGLKEMKLDGEKFDPFLHESAMSEESDKPEGTIVRTIQMGYTMNGEVLRHAIVSVSSGKKTNDAKQR